MFDHIGFGVTNLAESKAFFLKVRQPLGVAIAMEGPYGVGMGQKPPVYLKGGEVMRLGIDRLGTQTQHVRRT